LAAENVTGAVALVLVAVFGLAVAHKVVVVLQKKTASEPLLQSSSFLTQHSVLAFSVAGASEACICILLLTAPALGFVLTAILVLVYSLLISRLPPNEPCNCFGGLLEASSAGRTQIRNYAIAVVALTAAAVTVWTDVSAAWDTTEALSIAILLGGVVVALEMRKYIPRVQPRDTL
jgi:hypothetical protein